MNKNEEMKNEKIKLEEIVGYLPYGLKIMIVSNQDRGLTGEMVSLHKDYLGVKARVKQHLKIERGLEHIKPILHPLSDLTKEIEVDGEKFIPLNELKHLYGWEYMWSYVNNNQGEFNINAVKYACVKKLYEWHFDLFGLIEKNLAIDINTLKP